MLNATKSVVQEKSNRSRFFSQTVAKLKIELLKNNVKIIAVEGFEERGDVSFQMEKLKVIGIIR